MTGSQQVMEATRVELAFRDERPAGEHPMDFDYVAMPYSPTENNRLMQLQKLQQYLPLLMQSSAVDQEKLIVKLLDLLQMRDIIKPPPSPEEQAAMAQMAAQGAPPMPGMPPEAGMPPGPLPPEADAADIRPAGGLPTGIEPPAMPLPMGGPGFPNTGGQWWLQRKNVQTPRGTLSMDKKRKKEKRPVKWRKVLKVVEDVLPLLVTLLIKGRRSKGNDWCRCTTLSV
jgi:hypothetical protein